MTVPKCCKCLNLLKGVLIVGILFASFGLIMFLVFVCHGSTSSTFYWSFAALLHILVNIMLIMACVEKKRVYLIPWLIVMVSSILLVIAWSAVCIFIGSELINSFENKFRISSIVYFSFAVFLMVVVGFLCYLWKKVLELFKFMGKEDNDLSAFDEEGIIRSISSLDNKVQIILKHFEKRFASLANKAEGRPVFMKMSWSKNKSEADEIGARMLYKYTRIKQASADYNIKMSVFTLVNKI